MTVVITQPVDAISVEEAKAHLRVTHDLENDLIKGLVAAAVNHIDGPSGILGRSIGPQLLEMRGWFSCEVIRLDFPPALEIESITYEGEDGTRLTADPSTYHLHDNCVVVTSGAAWVSQPGHHIRFWAGYGRRDSDDPTKWIAEIPAALRLVIMLYVGAWYENREETAIGVSVAALPDHVGVRALLAPFKVYR